MLGLAGWAKARHPESAVAALRAAAVPGSAGVIRAVAAAELAVAVVGLAVSEPAGGVAVATTYGCLAAGAAVLARLAGGVDCGCFGEAETDPGTARPTLATRHVATNLLCAAVAGGAALAAPYSPVWLVAHRPAGALVAVPAALTTGLALRAWLRGTLREGMEASARRLVDSSALALESRFSRRSALVRLAVAGSALSVAPLRYLLYPGPAEAVVLPGDCSQGLCTDGYTAFCCEINQGVNGCPTGTFAGGWWLCTDYRGHQLCEGAGVRYYIDCNALPGHPFPGGCQCAAGTCDRRRQACNVFRYGQCNTHVHGTTAVVCRVVTCQNPGYLEDYNCSPAVMIDDAVCGHEAGCLEPAPVQLPGVGGA